MNSQIIKSSAHLKDYPQHFPIAPIKDNEKCCMCHNKVPLDSLVLRHINTNNIICLICLTQIAEIE